MEEFRIDYVLYGSLTIVAESTKKAEELFKQVEINKKIKSLQGYDKVQAITSEYIVKYLEAFGSQVRTFKLTNGEILELQMSDIVHQECGTKCLNLMKDGKPKWVYCPKCNGYW